MTKKEVINFLAKNSYHLKKDMRTIPQMIAVGQEIGYDIIKNGTDDYTIYESCAIKDFTKPLRIIEDHPDSVLEVFKGCPLGIMLKEYENGCYFHYPYQAWCYLAHKNNGDKIDLKEFQFLSKRDLDDIVFQFDSLKFLGYIEETEKEILFYFYPQKNRYSMPTLRWDNTNQRIAPLKY